MTDAESDPHGRAEDGDRRKREIQEQPTHVAAAAGEILLKTTNASTVLRYITERLQCSNSTQPQRHPYKVIT